MLIAAIEGQRPIPRKRPPYPARSGLWGRPTTVNNVETIACLPAIVERGADGFRALSRTAEGGTRLYAISGRVTRPPLVEAPVGTSAGEQFERCCGIAGGGASRAFQPGGGATAFLGPEHLDVPLDFAHSRAAGSGLGTGAVIVLDETACPVDAVRRHARFDARESCGFCTPCRDGLPWVARLLDALEAGDGRPGDLELLRHHVEVAGPSGRGFCDRMAGAMSPLASALDRFGELFRAHLQRACPVVRG